MKTIRYSILLLLCAVSPLVQAGDNGITIHQYIWEIHKVNGNVIKIPYYLLRELRFSKNDIDGVEQDDFVMQTLRRDFDGDLTDMIDSISFMRMRHVQEEHIYSNHDNVYSPQGFDVEIDYPEGSTVTHRQNWTEVKKVEDGKVKVRAGRNRSVFWRQDTIDVTYPNGMTVSIPFEQPGDEIFNSMEFSATISADIENTDYRDGETTTHTTWGSGFGGGTGGTKDCVLVGGKKGDRKHTYVVTINEHKEDSTPTVDGDIWGYNDWILNISVTIDVSFSPGKVESATIYDYRHQKMYGNRYYTTTFQANFGEMEGAYSQSFWSYELPTSFSWDKHNEITGDPPYRHTEKVLNVLGGKCRVEFHHY